MKKANGDGGAGLQEWLSYQSRTRAAVQPETDVIDWDDGIEVQEEWLPREMCEQRLREQSERKPTTATPSAPEANVTASVELEDVPLPSRALAASSQLAISDECVIEVDVDVTAIMLQEVNVKPTSTRELKSRPAAPVQFEIDDLASAVPAFDQ